MSEIAVASEFAHKAILHVGSTKKAYRPAKSDGSPGYYHNLDINILVGPEAILDDYINQEHIDADPENIPEGPYFFAYCPEENYQCHLVVPESEITRGDWLFRASR